MSESPQHRAIRSYVLRQGRVTDAQRLAHERLMPRFGLPFSTTPADLDTVFGRRAPRVLEIGFGMGDTTAAIAAAHPGIDYIAVEVHLPGVGSLLRLIEQLGLGNLRIVQHDAVEVVQHMLAPDSLAGAHVFFPDPWPKKRHHKRRLLQPAFVALLTSRLAPGGYLHVATDWVEYADAVLETLAATPGLENTAQGFSPRPEHRPLTKFENRGLKLGHEVRDIVFRRV
jgi:tRNA (guanine-N7-)-methyltransferase